jgi:hypothetical protein
MPYLEPAPLVARANPFRQARKAYSLDRVENVLPQGRAAGKFP